MGMRKRVGPLHNILMRVIGVIDLLGGRAVHARAGDRQKYAPVASVAGDAVRLARRYLAAGVRELYVADLNAILSGARQDGAVEALATLGVPLWVDAGISTIEAARECLALGATRVVVGLETLSSFDALQSICRNVGGSRMAFSIDLREGQPMIRPDAAIPPNVVRIGTLQQVGAAVEGAARFAASAGVEAIIVLDLAKVGMSTGVDPGLIARVRAAVPGVMLLAGGGIRNADDLSRLAAAGCDGALVATALHDGTLGAADIAALS
jgi:phosphoribosylformimino-5-aminoimidazole carboxamide ribotide isomerase